jgi:hypothetical protein
MGNLNGSTDEKIEGRQRMNFQFDDGGRKAAGYQGDTGDCVVRAITIATELPYQRVYDKINEIGKWEKRHAKPGESKSRGARNGIRNTSARKLLKNSGWIWTPTMHIGSGCKVHLRDGELPAGRLIVSVSKHLVAVIDGVIHDTHDCSRGGTRCVYGYWNRGDLHAEPTAKVEGGGAESKGGTHETRSDLRATVSLNFLGLSRRKLPVYVRECARAT